MSAGETVRGALLAQNRGDDATFLAAMHPDVVWEVKGTNPFGFPDRLSGREEIRAAAEAARERAGPLKVILHELQEAGDEVLVLGVLAAGKLSMPRAWIWTLRDGRARRIRSFGDHQAAREQWRAEREAASEQ